MGRQLLWRNLEAMKNKIILLGASGHGLVLADIAKQIGYETICFLDDNFEKEYPYPILGTTKDVVNHIDDYDFFIAIGNNVVRKRLTQELEQLGAIVVNLVHPSAIIAQDTILKKGIAVMANVVINSGSNIGNGAILNTACTIDHENIIGDFVHISPGSHLAGNVHIGEQTWLGIGSIIINNISITSGVVIGAGTTVRKNILKPGTYAGIPLRRINL